MGFSDSIERTQNTENNTQTNLESPVIRKPDYSKIGSRFSDSINRFNLPRTKFTQGFSDSIGTKDTFLGQTGRTFGKIGSGLLSIIEELERPQQAIFRGLKEGEKVISDREEQRINTLLTRPELSKARNRLDIEGLSVEQADARLRKLLPSPDLNFDVLLRSKEKKLLEPQASLLSKETLTGLKKGFEAPVGVHAIPKLFKGEDVPLSTERMNLMPEIERAISNSPMASKLFPEGSAARDAVKSLGSLGIQIISDPFSYVALGLINKSDDMLRSSKAIKKLLKEGKTGQAAVKDLPEIKNALETIEDSVPGLRESIKVEDTIRPNVVRDVVKQRKTIKELTTKFRSRFIDDTAELFELEKKVTGGIGEAEESIYKQARLFKGAPRVADEIIRTELAPTLNRVINKGYTLDDLGDYALAIHAQDVNNAGLKSGFTNKQIFNTIKKYGTPEMERARQELVAVSNSMLKRLASDGVISPQQFKNLNSKWENYMPLFRSFDDEKVGFAKGLSDSFSNVTSPIKALKGSDREVLDPIESMINNIYKTVDATMRNRVGQQLAKLDELDTANQFIRRLDSAETVGRKNVVNVTLNGVKTPFEVEPEIYKVFNNLDKESSNTLIKILAKPASVLRAGATLTPEFAMRNPMRDVWNAFVNSKSGFNPITDFPKGLASVIKKDKYYTGYLKSAGGFGNILSMDRQSYRRAVENVLKQPISKKFINVLTPKGFINVLRSVSDVTETATKVGEFRKALSKGTSSAEAAYRARDLMDFARSGSAIRPANRVVAFLNANIQGKSRLVRAIQDNPAKVTAKLGASMVLPTIGIKYISEKLANEKQKAIIDDAPDWLRSSFWLLPVPGTDIVARIPKPFDIAVVANTTERFMDYAFKKDPNAFDGFLAQTVKDNSLPVMMTGILPMMEAMSNYSLFREGPIIPRREEYLERQSQFDPRTSLLARGIAPGVEGILGSRSNLSSPRSIDYMLRSATGGLGSYALDAIDWFLDKTGIVDVNRPAKNITQQPLIKGFTVNQLASGKSVGELYDLDNELTRKKNSSRLNNVGFPDSALLKFTTMATDSIGDITKQMRLVEASDVMTPEEKRDSLLKLSEQRNNIARKAMDIINKQGVDR